MPHLPVPALTPVEPDAKQELYLHLLPSSLPYQILLSLLVHTLTSHDPVPLPAVETRDRHQEQGYIGLGIQGLHLIVCLLGF